jgi:hypothetical protein
MDLKLNPEQFEQLVSAVIVQQLAPESREEILKDAIAHLLTKQPDSPYSSRRVSPLQEAFNQAIRTIAYQVANEWLKARPEVRQQVEALVAEAYQKAVTEGRAEIVDRIAVQMSRAFDRD